jgi:hypothetical protein
VSRRPDPARICEAQRAGVVTRLACHIGPERAEQLVVGWELEAEAWLAERAA